MTNLLSLIDDLYYYIFLYLLPEDQLQFYSINQFFVRTLTKKYRRVRIDEDRILQFIKNKKFQQRLFNLIENSSKQLLIDVQDGVKYPPKPTKHPFFPNIWKLMVSFEDFQKYYCHVFETVDDLRIYGARPKTKEIKLLNCFENYQSTKIELENIQAKVIGFFPMTLKELKLVNCTNIGFDVSTSWWKTLHEIELYGCENITSLPDFFNFIPIVKITSCHGLEDVRALQDNERVELRFNEQLIDFDGCFKNCRILFLALIDPVTNFNLYNLEKIEDLFWAGSSNPPLIIPGRPLPPSLRKLKFSEGDNPTGTLSLADLSPFQSLEDLSINGIESLISVEGLGTIPVLELQDLANLQSLVGLGKGNKDVSIKFCDAVNSFLPLQRVEKVYISYSPLLNGNDVKYVTHLILESCPIEDVSPLANIPKLELISCMEVKNYTTLKNNKLLKVGFGQWPYPWTDDLKELARQNPTHRFEMFSICISRR